MLKYLISFVYDEDEIRPSEKQVRLRHLLHKQIVLSNIILKSPESKSNIADDKLIEYELNRLTKACKVPVKKKKKNKC